MKKTIITSIAAIAMAMPAIAANIPNNATCNSGVLGVSSGSANLEADYTANTINITWDGNGGSTPTGGASTCTYDTTFNLPSAPTKTGYTFGGWTVKTGPAQCSLSGLNSSTEGQIYKQKSFDGTYCSAGLGGPDDIYGCENSTFDGMSNGEWQIVFDYGVVKGTAYCSAKSGNNHNWQWGGDSSDWTATESELNAAGAGGNCWCKVTGYTPNGGDMCVPAASSWVFRFDLGSPSGCASSCVYYCGNYARYYASLRAGLFGSAAQ